MSKAELAVFAACYAIDEQRNRGHVDNTAAERALESALWSVECFRQALRERKVDE